MSAPDRLGQIFLGAFVVAMIMTVLAAVIPGDDYPIEVVFRAIGAASMMVLATLSLIFLIMLLIDAIIVRRQR